MFRYCKPMIACGAILSTFAVAAPALARDTGPTLVASPAGSSAASCTHAHPCSLTAAVAAAPAGATVIALPGTYDGGVVIDTPIRLIGHGATIDASTSSTGNGIQIAGPGGSGSTVEGFTIKNAQFEGILVGTAPVSITTTDGTAAASGTPVSDVRILDNRVLDNDAGFGTSAGQCFSTPNAPGDCGEAIHLVAVTDSVVAGNYVHDNAGGILLTDEFGPTSGNAIVGNRSIDNTDDCGITLAGHGTAVNPQTGAPTGTAGVFDNLVAGNVSIGNGVAGQGAGILLGGGAPFAGVYGNVIRNNYAAGNGLSGITLHQHFAGDLNDNVIVGNVLSNDNVDGDPDFFGISDTQTTGVLVAAGLPGPPQAFPPSLVPSPITGTVIAGNRFYDVNTGIWTLGVDPATTVIAHNAFAPGVVTPVSTN